MLEDVQLVIVRGLPGSGKSTLAREISERCGYAHFENDMFFETPSGYIHDRSRFKDAKRWCLASTKDALAHGRRVVVSNVFAKVEHMRDFVTLTDSLMVIECTKQYGNVHEVPEAVLASMQAAWEAYPGAVRF
ncbi:AAA family ATPase [Burkholderia vietnamiensis]|uniref:AAA family ATPase n=1 Tax=Burkholderia vietnamiensis TaxID=60552 RepID=A0AAW7T8U6_BURVI|nr:AAA family ATPase [Burkholderia vietnamiensis]MBH9645761.1 AAA family ATPase [Burkholderia vietnamiensis]MBR8008232.1 AAA family ATPase [Burkholderia vietnamiensis]MDN7551216.1 AAA family ATPase [Burkholderia vietnamiensis]MDN7798523.1 AAA family ATPase [Burkholderia vietnamiensis]MDN8044658.1 AAA family ATPase [Burkholderia vietnamiensis]